MRTKFSKRLTIFFLEEICFRRILCPYACHISPLTHYGIGSHSVLEFSASSPEKKRYIMRDFQVNFIEFLKALHLLNNILFKYMVEHAPSLFIPRYNTKFPKSHPLFSASANVRIYSPLTTRAKLHQPIEQKYLTEKSDPSTHREGCQNVCDSGVDRWIVSSK